MTLQRHIAGKKVTPPKLRKVGGVAMRLWSLADIERVRKQMEK